MQIARLIGLTHISDGEAAATVSPTPSLSLPPTAPAPLYPTLPHLPAQLANSSSCEFIYVAF